jgi:drug/metabolite transporter superfamily protein YnfA
MGDFDIKIWLWKGLKEAILVAFAAFLTAFAGYMEITTFPPEYTAYAGIFILVLHEIANFIKHTYLV